MTVKELKEILKEFKDDDIVSVFDICESDRYLIRKKDIDFCVEGYFEINIATII